MREQVARGVGAEDGALLGLQDACEGCAGQLEAKGGDAAHLSSCKGCGGETASEGVCGGNGAAAHCGKGFPRGERCLSCISEFAECRHQAVGVLETLWEDRFRWLEKSVSNALKTRRDRP